MDARQPLPAREHDCAAAPPQDARTHLGYYKQAHASAAARTHAWFVSGANTHTHVSRHAHVQMSTDTHTHA